MIKKAFLFYFSLILFSIIIPSCCSDTFEIFGSGTLIAYHSSDSLHTELDTISEAFVIVERFEVGVGSLEDLSIISSSMATTCDYKYNNSIRTNQLKISCDKDFTYDGNTIVANSDFSYLKELTKEFIQFRVTTAVEIGFQNSFINKAEFEIQEYTFKVTNKTDDDLDLVSEITLIMNL